MVDYLLWPYQLFNRKSISIFIRKSIRKPEFSSETQSELLSIFEERWQEMIVGWDDNPLYVLLFTSPSSSRPHVDDVDSQLKLHTFAPSS